MLHSAPPSRPPALVLCVLFFAASGALELVLPWFDGGRPSAWNSVGQALLHGLLALGLWRRVPLCRAFALVYCLAAIVTYGVVLGLALAHAPLRFPPSIVAMSLFQVPSCAVLLLWLRGAEADRAFSPPRRG